MQLRGVAPSGPQAYPSPLPPSLCSLIPEHLALGVLCYCENPDLLEAVEGSHSFECHSPLGRSIGGCHHFDPSPPPHAQPPLVPSSLLHPGRTALPMTVSGQHWKTSLLYKALCNPGLQLCKPRAETPVSTGGHWTHLDFSSEAKAKNKSKQILLEKARQGLPQCTPAC